MKTAARAGDGGRVMRLITAGLVVLMAIGGAYAADLPLPRPLPSPGAYFPPPVTDWGGLYIGANGGYGFGNSNWGDGNNPGNTLLPGGTTPSSGGSTGNFGISGLLLGGTVGANFQASALVLGVEADLDWSRIKGSVTIPFCSLPVSATAAGSTCETKNDWLGTARARFGYAADRVLFYGTAGAAFGDVQAGLTGAGAAGFAPASGTFQGITKFGWTAGAGVEVAFAPNWSAKVEYLFIDLPQGQRCNLQAACGVDAIRFTGITPASDSIKFTTNVVRFGVNYRFGPW
jgi:outer membrane immunogenic protein